MNSGSTVHSTNVLRSLVISLELLNTLSLLCTIDGKSSVSDWRNVQDYMSYKNIILVQFKLCLLKTLYIEHINTMCLLVPSDMPSNNYVCSYDYNLRGNLKERAVACFKAP